MNAKPVYVVMGGAGFIGSNVVAALDARNADIVVIDGPMFCNGTTNKRDLRIEAHGELERRFNHEFRISICLAATSVSIFLI